MKKIMIVVGLLAVTQSAKAFDAGCIGPAHLCNRGDFGAQQISRLAQQSRDYATIHKYESKMQRKLADQRHDALKKIGEGWKQVARGANKVDQFTKIVRQSEANQLSRGVIIPWYEEAKFNLDFYSTAVNAELK